MDKAVNTVLDLIENATNLTVVKDFLKSKGLHHSASGWDEIRNKRILPALEEGKLSFSDLVGLLCDVEEHGSQHVFLFGCSKKRSMELLAPERIKELLTSMGALNLMSNPLILDKPQAPTITDVRLSPDIGLVIKVIEKRISREFIGEEELENGVYVRKYQQIVERAVNIAKLHPDGLLEIRISSHRNSSNYKWDVDSLRKRVSDFIPIAEFLPISIGIAKDRLWKDRASLSPEIRFSASTFRNDFGSQIRASAGSLDEDLFEDEGVEESLEKFVEHDAYCDTTNIWFLIDKTRQDGKKIHVILSGELNEFSITTHCTMSDYEYVLNRIRSLNQPLS